MSGQRVQGKERREHGKVEEKIGKEFDDKPRQIAGKEQKEFGKVEEKIGKEKEKQEISSGSGYVCASCGATFVTYDERATHNKQVHHM